MFVVVAYISYNRITLSSSSSHDVIKAYFHTHHPVHIASIIKLARQLQRTVPQPLHPLAHMTAFRPLTSGQYPLFSQFPAYIENYELSQRDRIQAEEIELLRQRSAVSTIGLQTSQLKAEEESWTQHQKLLKVSFPACCSPLLMLPIFDKIHHNPPPPTIAHYSFLSVTLP